ncbi:MAG: flagellar basal-body rod protein FlgF [Methylococcales bacterium]|jgi:flagellar basal-body rod protein FlgF|nr:flagellar basal-body rod protein FlgF [Methylococcales bacterium]
MDRMVFLASSGADQFSNAMAINSNNLANASTTGFREDFQQLRSMPVFGDGLPTRVYAMTERPGSNFANGPINQTGRDLDVAVQGQGWLAVQGGNGAEGYTRTGSLHLSAEGLLQTSAGLPVLGNGGPITIPPAEKFNIGADGTISFKPLGADTENLVVLDRIKLVDPDTALLEKGNDGLFRQNNGQLAEPDNNVKLISGALEGSNVNVIESMVNMIELSRLYEMKMKMLKTAEEIDESAASMMQV